MSSTASSPPGTPRSTPGEDDASLILTPRSKIKALLASVSDDSDDDVPVTRRPTTTGSPKPKAPLFHAPLDDSDDDDDDEPMPAARPRGKLASRMMGAEQAPESAKAPSKSSSQASVEEALATARKSRLTKRSSPVASETRSSPPPSPKSPSATAAPNDSDSDDELPSSVFTNPKFQALVEKKRKERQEKEAEEKRLRMEKRKQTASAVMALHHHGDEDDDVNNIIDDDEMDEGSEEEHAKRRPRKAGKKAIEEMQKETQRIQRNMQLAHQAKPRKKITKQSLFDKFNFNPAAVNGIASSVPEPTPREPSPEVIPATPVETQPEPAPTPPAQTNPLDSDDDMPDIDDIFAEMKNASKKKPEPEVIPETQVSATPKKSGKGKGRAPPSPGILKMQGKSTPAKPVPGVKINLPIRPPAPTDDSDDDLEIVGDENNPEQKRLRLIAKKNKLIAEIRPKRRVVAPARGKEQGHGKQEAKKLYQQLMQKSRTQAVQEKEERIEELRSKGVIIPTAEEREKEQNEIEDLMEKARLEALDIKRREKKEEKLAKGEMLDSEDDGDWAESEEENYGESEEEGEGEDGSGDESENNPMLDDAAELSGSESETDPLPAKSKSKSMTASPATSRVSDFPDFPSDHDSDTTNFDPALKRKLARQKLRITDDDDEEDDRDTPKSRPRTPANEIPDIFKNPAMQPSPMGMTQLFAAGSMATTQTQAASSTARLDALRKGPDSELPNSQAPGVSGGVDFVPDTQLEPTDGPNNLTLQYGSQAADEDSDVDDSLPPMQFDIPSTQDIPDPTQDSGFDDPTTPAPPRFSSLSPGTTPRNPNGTVPTLAMEEDVVSETPRPVKRKGRLVRKIEDSDADDDDDGAAEEAEDAEEEEKEKEASPSQDDVFALMKAAAKQKRRAEAAQPLDTSKMRDMFEDQAAESDDEYAGLGGLSDDDANMSDAEALDEVMRDLVDDTNTEHLDEDQLAAFYLAREKAKDEKDVAKLFRDIQHGLLRKKRRAGDDLGLDDSDDEYLAQERRRRMKRRQMAEVRKMLLKDTEVERIAKNPKKSAFWKVLEDEEEASDEDFLDKDEADLYAHLDESQSQTPAVTTETGTPAAGSRPQTPDQPAAVNPRRTGARLKKPQHLSEIRQTLSFLTEDSTNAISHNSDSDSDIEITDAPPPRAAPIIDRTLSRSSTSQSALGKMAFATTPEDAMAGFRLPPTLLRRATTGLSSASHSSVGSKEGAGMMTEREMAALGAGGEKGKAVGKVKKGGMSVNFRKLKDREVEAGGAKGRGKERERKRAGGGVEVGGGRFE